MERIKLTKEKLQEILKEMHDEERMEYYYDLALNDRFEADQHLALLGLATMLVHHYHNKLFVNRRVEFTDFLGLNSFNEQSEYWRFKELLEKTNHIIALCLINNEKVPENVLIEFTEIQAYTYFCIGDYFNFLSISKNALTRDENNSVCNFLKSSIVEICYINKTSVRYKIALANYQKGLIDKCNPLKVGMSSEIYKNVCDEINARIDLLNIHEREVKFTPVSKELEETKKLIPEWTELHDFYLKNHLFLNPLSNFGKFAEASIEDFEELPLEQNMKDLFSEIVEDYNLCRGVLFSFYNGIDNVGKREMSMAYSYAYSIFDKIAFLLTKVYNLNIDEDNTGFAKNSLFDVKIKGADISFGKIKNVNIIPLYRIMKEVRAKQKIKNALQIGTLQHNELRNTIEHKSIALVEEDKLKYNSLCLLQRTRNVILHTFMLLHGYSKEMDYNMATATSTSFLKAILKDSNCNVQKVEENSDEADAD